jgi:hypothetical protein
LAERGIAGKAVRARDESSAPGWTGSGRNPTANKLWLDKAGPRITPERSIMKTDDATGRSLHTTPEDFVAELAAAAYLWHVRCERGAVKWVAKSQHAGRRSASELARIMQDPKSAPPLIEQ